MHVRIEYVYYTIPSIYLSVEWDTNDIMMSRKYGDLTAENTSPPLHYFRLPMKMQEGDGEFEVALPERLELGVSERGIVGRCVRVGVGMDGIGTGTGIVDMGRGVVGYD